MHQNKIAVKMKKIFGINFIIFLSLFFVSCAAKDEQQTTIRIVDLQGKAHPVVTKTPDLNVQALASQGRIQEERGTFRNAGNQATNPSVNNQQNLAQNSAPVNQDFGAASSEAIKNTLQSPSQPQYKLTEQKPESANNESIVAAGAVKEKEPQEENVEYDLTDSPKAAKEKTSHVKAKHTKKPVAKIAAAKTSSGKKFFVQVGSFSSISNANQTLTAMQKFHAGKVETVDGEKTIYRVLIGPFPSKASANEMVKTITGSGHEAILVRNK